MGQLTQLIFTVIFLVVVFFIGIRIEKNHYNAVKKKEKSFANLPAVSSKRVADLDKAIDSRLVSGCIVISNDDLKNWLPKYTTFSEAGSVFMKLFLIGPEERRLPG